MTSKDTSISVIELRQLLYGILDDHSYVCIRFRLLGEMWKSNFLRVIMISENGAMFKDERTNETIDITDLNNLMQFEIDGRFRQFQPHFHYDLIPDFVAHQNPPSLSGDVNSGAGSQCADGNGKLEQA